MRLMMNVGVLVLSASLVVVAGCAEVLQPVSPAAESADDDSTSPDSPAQNEANTDTSAAIPSSGAVDFENLVEVEITELSLSDMFPPEVPEPQQTTEPETDPTTDTDPETDSTEDDTVIPEDSPTLDYYAYVLIVDETPNGLQGGAGTYGADIVTVSHGGGPRLESSSTLHAAGFGPGDNSEANNAEDALGGVTGGCGFENNRYVSLGGAGSVEEGEGYIIVSFGDFAPLEEGHVIGVSECHVADEMTDYFSVYVGNSPNLDDPNWVPCEEGADSGTVCTIPALPAIE